MKAYIIYTSFLDFNTNQVTIGGIQTYIADLVKLLTDLELKTYVLQYGDRDETAAVGNYTVVQIKSDNAHLLVEKAAKSFIDIEKDLVIYGTDTLISKDIIFKNSIAIQHGIWWDQPEMGKGSRLKSLLPFLPSSFFLRREVKAQNKNAWQIISRLNYVKRVVCVDYNFVNWYRTYVKSQRTDLFVVPNYTKIGSRLEKPDGDINIIFARRFFWYRGTRIFTPAIKKILNEYDQVHVTIAGSGPDEVWMRQQLADCRNVNFINYKADESLKIHSKQHIAVVPTVGSEGTSLSLLEAMSAQCAVVCTDVGGMTSIVLNGYNGKIVRAGDSDELYLAIKYLLDNPNEVKRMAACGYETVKQCFSHEVWVNSWKKIIEEMIYGK